VVNQTSEDFMSVPDPANTAWVPLWDTGATGGSAFGSIPGEIKMWSGTVLPDPAKYGKWVWADGTAYDAATYPEASANIAAAWKTAHGAADPGAGKFRAPDLRGVQPHGLDAMPGGTRANRTTRTIAATMAGRTGEEYHALTLAEMASHSHAGATGTVSADHSHAITTGGASAGHVHYLGPDNGSFGGWTASGAVRGGDRGSGAYSPVVAMGLNYNYMEQTAIGGTLVNYSSGAHQDHSHSGQTGGISTNHTHAITAEGGGGAHENLPPTIFVPYIVRLDG
jgi:microcystin-dependent protein